MGSDFSGIFDGREVNTHLCAKVRLIKAVTVHHSYQIFENIVEHLVKLFPNHGQWLLGRQCGRVEFNL